MILLPPCRLRHVLSQTQQVAGPATSHWHRLYGCRCDPYTGFSAVALARSAALASSLGIFFVGLRFVPIANAITLFTVQGLFCLIFAHLLLGERMRPIHLLFLALANVGFVIIVRPAELGDHPLVNVMPVISATLFDLLHRSYLQITTMPPSGWTALPGRCLWRYRLQRCFSCLSTVDGDGSTANRPNLSTIVTAPAIAALIGTIS